MFPDIAALPAESREAIEYLVRGEIIKGTSPLSFAPGAHATREQIALLIWRVLNWPRLAADELRDATAFLMLFTSDGWGGGSAWWRAPRALCTNQHVATETYLDGTAQKKRLNDFLALANGGWVRNDRSPTGQPQFGVVWDEKDPRDIAYLVVPYILWEAYLNAREAAGLSREPLYIDPKQGRELVQGEPITIMGSPLMYDFTLSEGIASKVQVVRTEGDHAVEYVMTSASINPGNSGGLALTFDRRFVGMPTLKPWTHTSFGWGPGDDLGLILHWREILKWEAKQAWKFEALGIQL